MPETPEFHLDFMFMGEKEGGDKLAVLVVQERLSRMLVATVAPSKSTGEYVAKRVVAFMKETGSDQIRVGIKSDDEPAIVDLVERVGRVRESRGAQPMAVENSVA